MNYSILLTHLYKNKICNPKIKNKDFGEDKEIKVTRNRLLWSALYANKNAKEYNNQVALKEYIKHISSDVDYYFDLRFRYLKINSYLDAEEISYYNNSMFDIGMIVANINALCILKVRHLYHTKRFINKNSSCSYLSSKKICDFVAENAKSYYLIEAKGTSQGKNLDDALCKATKQLVSMGKFKGVKPTQRYVSLAYKNKKNKNLESQLVDPDGNEWQEFEFSDFAYNVLPLNLMNDYPNKNVMDKYLFFDDLLIGYKKEYGEERDFDCYLNNKRYEATLFPDGLVLAHLQEQYIEFRNPDEIFNLNNQ